MATHPSVAVPTGGAKALADIDTGIGTITGVTKDGNLGADGVSGGVTDRPIMGIAGVALTIDDATYTDPGTGALGTEKVHTDHYPDSANDYDRESKLLAAVAVLTLALNVADAETITVGTKTYTFEDTLTNVDGNIHVGADLAASLVNLMEALTLGPGAGTDYAAAMTLSDEANAVELVTGVRFTAKTPGVAGNSLDSTETLAGAGNVFAAATFLGGIG